MPGNLIPTEAIEIIKNYMLSNLAEEIIFGVFEVSLFFILIKIGLSKKIAGTIVSLILIIVVYQSIIAK